MPPVTASVVAEEKPDAKVEDTLIAENEEKPDSSTLADLPDAPSKEEGTLVAEIEAGQEGSAQNEVEAPKRRKTLRARVLKELGCPAAAMERLGAELVEAARAVEAAEAVEAERQRAVEEVQLEVDRESKAVEEATVLEAQAVQCVKDIREKKKQAAKHTALVLKELQGYEDMLVLLDFEKEKHKRQLEAEESLKGEEDAKRQKIEELLRVVEEAKQAQDELKRKAKEARQQVRDLEKEQRKLRLGAFGRRQAAKAKDTEAKDTEAKISEGPENAGVEVISVKREIAAVSTTPSASFQVGEVVCIDSQDSQ